jgi:hypothetical protein
MDGSTHVEKFLPALTAYPRLEGAEARVQKLVGESKDETVYGAKISDCVQRYLDSRKDKLGRKAHGAYAIILGIAERPCCIARRHLHYKNRRYPWI